MPANTKPFKWTIRFFIVPAFVGFLYIFVSACINDHKVRSLVTGITAMLVPIIILAGLFIFIKQITREKDSSPGEYE